MVDKAAFGFFHPVRAGAAPQPPTLPRPSPRDSPIVDIPAASPHPGEKVSPFSPPADRAINEAAPAADIAASAWNGIGTLHVAISADQLGIADPAVISVSAALPGSQPIELDASSFGLYRPAQLLGASSISGGDNTGDLRTGVAAGTRILTSRGEIEVETLKPGDAALALRGPALLPIIRIGRTYAVEAPVWIDAGALGPNLPRRDLCLAPDQAMFLEPAPVLARSLVNGTTIRRLESAQVEICHIDVGQADVLFAEGVPLASVDRSSAPSIP